MIGIRGRSHREMECEASVSPIAESKIALAIRLEHLGDKWDKAHILSPRSCRRILSPELVAGQFF